MKFFPTVITLVKSVTKISKTVTSRRSRALLPANALIAQAKRANAPIAQAKRANALISTLIIVGIIGMATVSGAQIVHLELQNTTKVEEGSIALAAAQAGIEDGLLRYRYNPEVELPGGPAGSSAGQKAIDFGCVAASYTMTFNGDQITQSSKENASIPTSETPYYVRVNLSYLGPNSGAMQPKMSEPFDRSCTSTKVINNQDYLHAVGADVKPTDRYYDLKISFREQMIGRIPGQPIPSDTNMSTYISDQLAQFNANAGEAKTFCGLAGDTTPTAQNYILCILQKKMNAIKIPKDTAFTVAFPDVPDVNNPTQLKPVGYGTFKFSWEADLNGVFGSVMYGLEVIHADGAGQVRQTTLVNDPQPSLLLPHTSLSNDKSGFAPNSILLNSANDPAGYRGSELIRFRAVGADVWLIGWGDPLSNKNGNQTNILLQRLDAGKTVIEAIGQFGKTQRTLTTMVNRADRRVQEGYDFTIYSGAAPICITNNC